MSDTTELFVEKLHYIIKINNTLLNMDGVDMSNKFDHCSVILYYTGVNLKEKCSLVFYYDCVFSPINGKFVTISNSQVANTSAVIYSIGVSCNLHWKRRKIGLSNTGHSK